MVLPALVDSAAPGAAAVLDGAKYSSLSAVVLDDNPDTVALDGGSSLSAVVLDDDPDTVALDGGPIVAASENSLVELRSCAPTTVEPTSRCRLLCMHFYVQYSRDALSTRSTNEKRGSLRKCDFVAGSHSPFPSVNANHACAALSSGEPRWSQRDACAPWCLVTSRNPSAPRAHTRRGAGRVRQYATHKKIGHSVSRFKSFTCLYLLISCSHTYCRSVALTAEPEAWVCERKTPAHTQPSALTGCGLTASPLPC